MNIKPGRHQLGLGIVEMMISIALSSLLVLGVLQIFEANRQSVRLTNAFSRMQENGRMATEILLRDLRMADFWGCAPNTGTIVSHLSRPTDPLNPKPDDDWKPEMEFTGMPGLDGIDEVDAAMSLQYGGIDVKLDTDVITIRGSYTTNAQIKKPYMTTSSAALHIMPGVDIPLGTILMVTDCEGADLFSSTSNNTTGGTLNHNGGNIVADGAVNNFYTGSPKFSQTYTANAQIVIPFVRTYFVGQNPDGGWSLYRRDMGENQELVRNVSDLNFIYGEDTNNDLSADKFASALPATNAVGDMESVISVRASLTITSADNVSNGNPLERTFTVTSNIRNRSL